MRRTLPITSENSYIFADLSLWQKARAFIIALKHSYATVRCYAALKYGYLRERIVWRVDAAGAKGEGLFATEDVAKGSLVFTARGPVEYGHFEESDCYLFPDWYMVDDNTWIDIQPPYIKINHSCDPNLGIDGSRCFVALRDITAGEEFSFDYSITDDELDWEMSCLCGSPHCRKTVRAIQRTEQVALLRSHPYIPPFFRARTLNKP